MADKWMLSDGRFAPCRTFVAFAEPPESGRSFMSAASVGQGVAGCERTRCETMVERSSVKAQQRFRGLRVDRGLADEFSTRVLSFLFVSSSEQVSR